MSGTRAGGINARESIILKHGADFWKKIGAEGGKVSKRNLTSEEARRIGRLGGRPKHSYK